MQIKIVNEYKVFILVENEIFVIKLDQLAKITYI